MTTVAVRDERVDPAEDADHLVDGRPVRLADALPQDEAERPVEPLLRGVPLAERLRPRGPHELDERDADDRAGPALHRRAGGRAPRCGDGPRRSPGRSARGGARAATAGGSRTARTPRSRTGARAADRRPRPRRVSATPWVQVAIPAAISGLLGFTIPLKYSAIGVSAKRKPEREARSTRPRRRW